MSPGFPCGAPFLCIAITGAEMANVETSIMVVENTGNVPSNQIFIL